MILNTPTDSNREWRHACTVAACFQIALAGIVALSIFFYKSRDIASIYFVDQDAYVLIASSITLVCCGGMVSSGRGLPTITLRWLIALCIMLFTMVYAMCFIVFHHYALTRDEQSAEFAAQYLSRGLLGWPIPANLRDLGQAMMPLYTTVRSATWNSAYLPVNAMIRGVFQILGDQWVAGPTLLIFGVVCLWSCARRIWPQERHAATVVVVMAATSAQLLLTAATPFAMTAHFALNSFWLACFVRGGRLGHSSAIIVGLLASGLHQSHFLIAFVLGFVVWLAMERRYWFATLYLASCIFYWYIWTGVYPALLTDRLGSPTGWSPVAPVAWWVSALDRLLALQPGESFTRFIAWQNLLLLPLAAIGARSALRGYNDILAGCAIACLIGIITPLVQDHGLGYRYLHHLIPCFCLLAAGGWLELERSAGKPLPMRFLWVSVAFCVLVAMPVFVWRTMVAAAPYERAYHAASTADADYVFVDTRAGAYLESIVRVERDRSRPILLDLGYVPYKAMKRLCAHSRTMLFSTAQARAFGITANLENVVNNDATAIRRRQLDKLHCAPPMPV